MPAGLDVEHSDDLAAGYRDDRPGSGLGELCGALVDVDRRLCRDTGAFPGHGSEKLSHRPRIAGLCGPDRDLRHTGICSHSQHVMAYQAPCTLTADQRRLRFAVSGHAADSAV